MTDGQLELALAPLVHAEPDATLTIQQRFDQFHANNEWVYTALEHLIADWLATGHRRASVDNFMHVIRWQYGRRTTGDQGFKCNSDFTSRYARLLIQRNPSWESAIETRALRAA